MAKYVYTMRRVSKTVPPQRTILKNISLNFFPGAKIGVLGLNGSGKSSLLKIMAGVDEATDGEVIRMPGINVGYLPQEPALDAAKTVREEVEAARSDVAEAKAQLEAVYAAYSDEGADFDKLAAEQARLEAIVNESGGGQELEIAADALRLPAWEQKIGVLSGGERSRVALARLLINPGNLLLMDEPTNHLDLDSAEALAESLTSYDGTMLFVSHNRSFVRRLATRIWNVEDGHV